MKVITICGSIKFIEEMKYLAEKLELENNCVLSVIYPTKNKECYTEEEIHFLQKGHLKRIDISDAIFVVNKNGYIEEAVREEIEYAKRKNKKIIYLEDWSNRFWFRRYLCVNWSNIYRNSFEKWYYSIKILPTENDYNNCIKFLSKYNTRINFREKEVSSNQLFIEIIEILVINISEKIYYDTEEVLEDIK